MPSLYLAKVSGLGMGLEDAPSQPPPYHRLWSARHGARGPMFVPMLPMLPFPRCWSLPPIACHECGPCHRPPPSLCLVARREGVAGERLCKGAGTLIGGLLALILPHPRPLPEKGWRSDPPEAQSWQAQRNLLTLLAANQHETIITFSPSTRLVCWPTGAAGVTA